MTKQKHILFILLGFFCMSYAQQPILKRAKQKNDNTLIKNKSFNDSLNSKDQKSTKKAIKPDVKIQDYLVISHQRDTTFVDTTLTIKKAYKFNYLRRDNFGLMPFSNVGQTYNTLSYSFNSQNLMPLFGARARHFNYMEVADINYYNVPTPVTELYFKTAFEQGQQLDAFFTVNTTPNFNFSIAYKGIRSLGKYQHILTSTGNFRVTASYKTKNKRYVANIHAVSQDLLNEENGGIKDDNIIYFETGNPEFKDRSVLEVNFEDAESILKGKRFYLNHYYNILRPTDSVSKNTLRLNHILSFEDKYYKYSQNSPNDYFGDSYRNTKINKSVTLQNFYNQLALQYKNAVLGDFSLHLKQNQYNYGYNKVVLLNNNYITNRLKGTIIGVGANYTKQLQKFNIQAAIGSNVSGNFTGNYFTGKLNYNINPETRVQAQISFLNKAPNFNYQLYQSQYINYNWKNQFKNTQTTTLQLQLASNKYGKLTASYHTINNYAYFQKETATGLVKPFQNNNTINYIKVKSENNISIKKFGLDNTVLYQQVHDTNNTFQTPQLVTRNALYYKNHFFKNALQLQTGITFNYFTKYYMNGYDPVLAEFYTQTNTKYGNFPRFDVFANAKIRQARIFLIAEHINAAWTGYNYYAAPNYPYRDFALRFGIVWNFFL